MGTRDILKLKKDFIKGKVLDLGAGQGKYRKIIESYGNSYVAFDVEESPNIDVVGDIHSLPFDDSSFDTVICTQVFEHIEKPWDVVDEIQRVLRDGGCAIITAPFMIPYHAHPGDYYRYTDQGMKSLFEEKFEVIEVQKYGKVFVVMAEMIRFACISPYESNGRIKKFFIQKIISSLQFLDRFSKSEEIYSNVLLVVRK